MSKNFEVEAITRDDMGKGASRRLRRNTSFIPAIIYGGQEKPVPLSLNANEINKALKHEAFYSQILSVKVDGKAQKAVLKDIQRHPSKPSILHMDFQRVSSKEKITMRVPLHFLNEETAPGVKLQGGIFSHIMTDVEIKCLPGDLPEFIEVDTAALEMDQSIHLSELSLPNGVELAHPVDADHDSPIVNIHAPRAMAADDEETSTEEGEGEGEEKGKEESSDS